MWTQSTMSIPESVVISALGISVVFITLIVLALAIVIISKILRVIIKDEVKPAAAPVQPAVSDEADKETLAVLMATIGVDLNLSPEEFKIVDVKEIR